MTRTDTGKGGSGVRRLVAILAGMVLAVAVTAPALAAPTTGTTTLVNPPPTSGETLLVDASVHSITPVVPYEYAIQNECAFPHKGGSSLQNDDIVTWTSEDANGDPHVTLPINLQSIPAGSKCKVFLVRNGNVVVKGSTTSYTVQP